MYKLGHRHTHHYLIGGVLLVTAGLLVGSGVAVSRTMFQSRTVLHQAAPVVSTVVDDSAAQQHISKNIFEFDLPTDWHEVAAPQVRYAVYSWAGTKGDNAQRRLDLYVDNVPLGLAVNRLQPVQAAGDHFDIIGTTSDNCTSFTPRAADSAQTGNAPSKWNGVNFLCDIGNYERDVVATGSAEGVNITTLTGGTSGSHRVLLIYTDNNSSPDYTIFASIIKTFRIK